MEKVNETDILVLKKQTESFSISKIRIEDSSCIIKQIKEVVDDPKTTVLDVQSMFWNNINCIENSYLYTFPYNYSDSYISGSIKPKKWTEEKYKTELEEYVAKYSKSNPDIDLNKIRERYKMEFKSNYYNTCQRYIRHKMLYNAFQDAKNDSSVVMYSHEYIGWTNFKYNITDDIKIGISTNFGYGYSSYFTLLASYKDINIAPLTHVAHYYRAEMKELIKCTRDYYVERDNWIDAFEFVKDFVNSSLNDLNRFVEQYIVKETDEMMRFLREIMNDPKCVIDKFKKESKEKESKEKYKRLMYTHPLDDDECKLFEIYPHEMNVIFQSEKLREVTYTLNKIKEICNIHPKANDYIKEIIEMIILVDDKN